MSIRDEVMKKLMDTGFLIAKKFCSLNSIKSNYLRSVINKLRKKGISIGTFKDDNGNTGYHLVQPDSKQVKLKKRKFSIIQPQENIPNFKVFINSPTFNFMSIGDVHLDNKFKKTELIKFLNKCRKKNICVLLTGDIFEMATRYSVGAGVYVQSWNNHKQSEEILRIVLNYRDIILMILEGNHERRAFKEIGISPLRQIANIAQLPFVSGRANIDICTSETTRQVTVIHEPGSSAQTPQGKIKAAYKKIRPVQKYHFYISAHLHDGLSNSDLFHTKDDEDGRKYRVREFAVMNPSFIKYFDSYGDHKGCPIGTGIWRYCFINGKDYGLKEFYFEKYVK